MAAIKIVLSSYNMGDVTLTTYCFIVGVISFIAGIAGMVSAFSIGNRELTRLRKLKIVRDHSEYIGEHFFSNNYARNLYNDLRMVHMVML